MCCVDTKRCSRCRETKPVNEFYARRDGAKATLRSPCKACLRIAHRERRRANPAKARAEWHAYAKRNPDKIAQYVANRPKEQVRASSARHRARNRTRVLARRREIYAANIEAERERARLRVRRRRVGKDRDSVEYMEGPLADDPCSYCGNPATSVDHIDPIALGGSNHWSNLTAACASCNGGKCDTPLLFYLLRR